MDLLRKCKYVLAESIPFLAQETKFYLRLIIVIDVKKSKNLLLDEFKLNLVNIF